MKKILLYTLGFIFIAGIIGGITQHNAPAKPEKTAEQKARDERNFFVAGVVRQVRDMLNDPKSFELVDVIDMDDGTICVSYRAKNPFGATMPGKAVAADTKIITSSDTSGRFVAQWNKRCANKTGRDLTRYTQQYL